MSIKNLGNKLRDIIFIGASLLGVFMIYAGIKGSKYSTTFKINWYMVTLGVLLLVPYVLIILKMKHSVKKSEERRTDRINDLLKFGDKVTVNLDDVIIKTNSYKHQIEIGVGLQSRNEYKQIHQCVILINIPYKEHCITVETHRLMELEKLKMYFAIQGTTTFYIDPDDLDNYYLDLRFLDN